VLPADTSPSSFLAGSRFGDESGSRHTFVRVGDNTPEARADASPNAVSEAFAAADISRVGDYACVRFSGAGSWTLTHWNARGDLRSERAPTGHQGSAFRATPRGSKFAI
jgi:hypothetical protein